MLALIKNQKGIFHPRSDDLINFFNQAVNKKMGELKLLLF